MIESTKRIKYKEKEIILIATAHVSMDSVELVRRVIEEEQPDSVCIELDERRYENIRNPKAWEETDIIKVIKTKRVGFMLANLALSSYQKKMAKKLNTTVGGEMLQGMRSAEECNAGLVLADRDIQTTFLRIYRKLNFIEKSKLVVSLFFTFDEEDEEIGEAKLQEMLKQDMLESMLAEIYSQFPKIGDILIHERDQYLSHKIKTAPGKKIVAVLGGAHVPGVMKEINHEIDMEEINTVPKKKPYTKALGWLIPALIMALFVYAFAQGIQNGFQQLGIWVLWNGGMSALFTLLAFGHPLSVITSFAVAPVSSLHPLFAVGWFSGIVQATIKKPTVADLHEVQTDILSVKGFFRNRLLKILLVVIMANLGCTLGTFIAGADLIKNLFK